nr:protoglobin domain-containing protein [Falsiroseomonas frigidaquae]
MIPVGTRDRRLLAFGIESQHLQCLRLHAASTRRLLPAVLLQSAASFVQWPEIHTALQVPAVSDVRSQHWMRVVGGEVEDGFAASARSLATAFYDHGVPGYAMAICHSAVTSGIAATLTSAPIRSWPFGRGSGDFKGVPLLAEALGKVAWLDLEVLLETYAEVEKARRESAQRQIKHFQHRIQSVAKTVGSCATSVEQNAKTLSWSVHQTSQKATDARDASVEASENVRSVVGAAEHLSATIGEVAQ